MTALLSSPSRTAVPSISVAVDGPCALPCGQESPVFAPSWRDAQPWDGACWRGRGTTPCGLQRPQIAVQTPGGGDPGLGRRSVQPTQSWKGTQRPMSFFLSLFLCKWPGDRVTPGLCECRKELPAAPQTEEQVRGRLLLDAEVRTRAPSPAAGLRRRASAGPGAFFTFSTASLTLGRTSVRPAGTSGG